MKPWILVCIGLAVASSLSSQEALLSDRAEYFDLLALNGMVERPTLNYRTLSDDTWDAPTGVNPWQDMIARSAKDYGFLHYRLYGPELFASENTAQPHGTNDGLLWQGVGLNSSLVAGVRATAFGVEATLKPEIAWEQNLAYDIMAPANPSYSPYSSYRVGIDQPQRFGDSSIFAYSWGDSEIRYSLGPATIGFGTQAVWLGPAQQNPIILSNNAPPFPKLDIGLRKTKTPIGDVELRFFWGQLTTSDYYNVPGMDPKTLFELATLSYAPSFLPGLTFGINRIMLTPWGDYAWAGMLNLLQPYNIGGVPTGSKQLASATIDYRIPTVGLEAYLEWGRMDYSSFWDYYLRYPFHTQGYTLGMRKAITLSSDGMVLGVLDLEITDLESSRDYEFLGPTSFYAWGYAPIIQGYTNEGQVLGAGIGTGGNSQYLGFTVYYPRGKSKLFVQRLNYDDDYVYFLNFGGTPSQKRPDEYMLKAELAVGAESTYFLNETFSATAGITYSLFLNPLFNPDGVRSSLLNNFYFTSSIKMML